MERCFKFFFSKYAECEWLNKMGAKGYFLEKISDHFYYFTVNKNCSYSYSIEYLDLPQKSDAAIEIYESRESKNEIHLFRKGKWDYFYTTGKRIKLSADSKKKISELYLWRSIYMLFFSITGTVLCAYQIFAKKFIIDVFGHRGDGQFDLCKLGSNKTLNALKEFWNKILTFFNDTYFKLFTKMFGENSVALVMAFLLPITIACIVFFALNLDEYIFWKYIHSDKLNSKSKAVKRK